MLTHDQVTMLESIRDEPRSTRHIADGSWERADGQPFTDKLAKARSLTGMVAT